MSSKPSTKATRFYAESNCDAKHASGKREGEQCSNKAYYRQGGKYLCGVHSRDGKRTKLEKNPNAKENKTNRLRQHQESVDTATERNRKEGRAGQVICSKIGMMTRPDDVNGYLKVFPNYKHQNRADGFGCASLSPMSLGPVKHRQKGLPDCKLLENYHQFNKVYDCDLGKDGKPDKKFYKDQISAYRSSTGQRHKYKGKMMIKGVLKRPSTLYCLHLDTNGRPTKYDYVQSRYLYCYFYEKLVKGVADLATLRSMLKKGTNLQLVGYDGYPVIKDLMFHYTNPAKPFGHEMVLYTLLTESDPREYPWHKYYEMFGKELYPENIKPDYLSGESTTSPDKEEHNTNTSGKTEKSHKGDRTKKSSSKIDKLKKRGVSKNSTEKRENSKHGAAKCKEDISESSPDQDISDMCIEEYDTD